MHQQMIFLISSAIALILNGCPSPEFKDIASPLSKKEQKIPLPIFYLPERDIENGNGIECVFIDTSNPQKVIFTVIFKDEDHPLFLFDLAYDAFRWYKYHRIMDIEGFEYRYKKGKEKDGKIEAIHFGSTYSEDQTFAVFIALHYEATISFSDFKHIRGRPLIYVNTWNHMFSEKNQNPGLNLKPVFKYPVYRGSREEAEKMFEEVYQRFARE